MQKEKGIKVKMNVGFISLGCSKNLIDTEATIGIFKEHKFNIVNDEEKADILVINTCGFIESAKEEAINTILEMAEYKNKRGYLSWGYTRKYGSCNGRSYVYLFSIE